MGQSPALCRPFCHGCSDEGGAVTEVVVGRASPSQQLLCSSIPTLCFDAAPAEPPGSPLSPGSPGQRRCGAHISQECCMSSPQETAERWRAIVVGGEQRERVELNYRFSNLWSKQGYPRLAGGEGGLSRSSLLQPHLKHKFNDYYDLGRQLGQGSFGDVFEAELKPVDQLTGRPAAKADDAGGSTTSSSDVTGNAQAGGGNGKLAGDAVGGASGPPVAHEAFAKEVEIKRRTVAVKVFNVSPPAREEGATPRTKAEHAKRRSSFETERSMLASSEHPNIVRMYECFQEDETLYIVMEQCRGGELYTRLVQHSREVGGGGFDEVLSRVLFRQMLRAVGYLHAKRIVHRDIKTENFLLLGEIGTPEANVLKLCDFGTTTVLTDQVPRSMDNIGTLSYTAPEIYMCKGADCPADCWSLGVVLYVILTGTNPFRVPGSPAREETVRRIRQASFDRKRPTWLQLSHEAQDLVEHCLLLEESARMTCADALRHPWLPSSPSRALANASKVAPHAPRLLALLSRLARMAEAQRLALAACALVATEADLSASPVPWRELFLALDEDQDGRLTYVELALGLKRLLGSSAQHLPDRHLEECVLALDLDGSGAIEWVEFVAVAVLGSKAILEAEEPLSTAFRLLDRPLNDNIAALDRPRDQASEIIGQWVPEDYREVVVSGVKNPRMANEEGRSEYDEGISRASPRMTLSDLRFVLGSTEVYEML